MIGLLDMIRSPLPKHADGEMPQASSGGTEQAGENFLSVFFNMLVAPTPVQVQPPASGASGESTESLVTVGSGQMQVLPGQMLQTNENATATALMQPLTAEEQILSPEFALSSPNRDIQEKGNASTAVASAVDSSVGQSRANPQKADQHHGEVMSRQQPNASDIQQKPQETVSGSGSSHHSERASSFRAPHLTIQTSVEGTSDLHGRAADSVLAVEVPAVELKALAARFATVQLKDLSIPQLEKRSDAPSLSAQTHIAVEGELATREPMNQPAGQGVSGGSADGTSGNNRSLTQSSQMHQSIVSNGEGNHIAQEGGEEPIVLAESRATTITDGGKGHSVPILSSPSVASNSRGEVAGKVQAEQILPRIPDDFARNLMVKISDELKLHLDGKTSEIRIRLKPDVLGGLSLKMVLVEGTVTAVIEASQQNVRAALEAQVPQMREALASQGIDVRRFEIISGGEMQSRHSGEGHANKRQRRFRGDQDVDVAEQLQGMKKLGYNTVEYII